MLPFVAAPSVANGTITCWSPDKHPQRARTRCFHRLVRWRRTRDDPRDRLTCVAQISPHFVNPDSKSDSSGAPQPALLPLRQFLVEI